ncbi:MAG TPA: alpha/beta hydrolase [Afipia sp.]
MSDTSVIDLGEWPHFRRHPVRTKTGTLNVRVHGDKSAPAVLLNHSILTSSAIWSRQAGLLAKQGYFVLCLDGRGHGHSSAPAYPYSMNDLVDDNIGVLDHFGIAQVHFVGVSLGGMTGLGLGAQHSERVASLMICAARADAPEAFAAAWDPRIALVQEKGISALARATAERWFGADFLNSNPVIADRLLACIDETAVDGFIGCARAIQGLNYIAAVPHITAKTSLVIGSHDELLLSPMRDLAKILPGATFVEIEGAGHLPQIDRPAEFDKVLTDHLSRASAGNVGV